MSGSQFIFTVTKCIFVRKRAKYGNRRNKEKKEEIEEYMMMERIRVDFMNLPPSSPH